MNKRLIWLLASIVLLAIVFALPRISDYFKKPQANVSYQMDGQIIEVRSNSIVVKGMLKLSDPTIKENKTIEFVLTPETVFNKTLYIVPKKIEPSVIFTPETKKEQGNIADLTVGKSVSLRSKDNLFDVNQTIALNINYEIIERQK